MYKLLFAVSLLLPCAKLSAQDPVFSQFYASGLHLNPALSGLGTDVVVSANYRSQWGGLSLPYRTFQMSAIHPIVRQGLYSKTLGGVGANVFSDEAGAERVYRSQGLAIASSYNFHLARNGQHIIAAALQFAVVQRRVNFDHLQWSSQYSEALGYNPTLPGEHFANEHMTTPHINAGLMWRLVKDEGRKSPCVYYNGMAIANLNRPATFGDGSKSISALVLKVHGGFLHTLDNELEISPNYLIQHQGRTQVNIGVYAAYPLPVISTRPIHDFKVSLGTWYRIDDSFILTAGATTTEWTCGVSYDMNTSSLSRYFPGASAFELSFSYRIKALKQELQRISAPLI